MSRIVHPVFDITPKHVLFGFRVQTLAGKSGAPTEEHILIVRRADVDPEVIWRQENDTRIEIGEERLVLDTRYDSPRRIEDEWPALGPDSLSSLEAPEPKGLYERMKSAIHRHVDVDPGAEVLMALWPVISFIYPAFAAVPFLLFLGPKSTGKSEALNVLAKLSRSGHRAITTAAGIGDLIQAQRATILIDQANGLHEGLIEVLVDSYKHGARRTVVNENQRGKPHDFETFGPKAFAAHRDFNEDLLDRCVQIPMSPAARKMEPLQAHDTRLDEIRSDLYAFVLLNFEVVFALPSYICREGVGEMRGLEQRPLELWWPFEVVGKLLKVPDEDMLLAFDFFQRSLPNTTAELPSMEREDLELLLDLTADAADDESVVTSRDLPTWHATRIGKLLRNHGLLIKKTRPRINGTKTTTWRIDVARLRTIAERWGLEWAGGQSVGGPPEEEPVQQEANNANAFPASGQDGQDV